MRNDPRNMLNNSNMHQRQVFAVLIGLGLSVLDGFDVLAISFAAPEIAREWNISAKAIGMVLAMELIGMSIGSIFLARLADKLGRRPVTIACLIFMGIGMLCSARADSVTSLSIWRIATGIGVGGMLATVTALVAELANEKRRSLCVAMTSVGYGLGAALGGLAAATVIDAYGWRALFYIGGAASLLFFPLVYFFVPESIAWLLLKQPADALRRVNNILTRFNKPLLEALPPVATTQKNQDSWLSLFSNNMLQPTVLLTCCYFLQISTFYFLMKWVPSLIVARGFTSADTGEVLMVASLAGVCGSLLFGLLSQRFELFKFSIAVFLAASVALGLFGFSGDSLVSLTAYCSLAVFCVNAGIAGLYAVMARVYPTAVRAFGVGFTLSIGRGGSIVTPIAVGFLVALNISQSALFLIVSAAPFIVAILFVFLRNNYLRTAALSADGEDTSSA